MERGQIWLLGGFLSSYNLCNGFWVVKLLTPLHSLTPLCVALGNQGQLPPRSMLEYRRGDVRLPAGQSLPVPPSSTRG